MTDQCGGLIEYISVSKSKPLSHEEEEEEAISEERSLSSYYELHSLASAFFYYCWKP
jgi:hypothetical protein